MSSRIGTICTRAPSTLTDRCSFLPSVNHTHSNPTSSLYSSHSSLPINPLLTFELTTPPTPNAGTILQIRATALLAQLPTTMPTLPPSPTILAPGLLYKSRPSKCNGVLISWIAAGVTNCATLAAVTYFFISSPIFCSIFGASKGGRLNEAKMVRQSRTVKRANVGSGTGRLGPDDAAAKSWVNLLSL